MGDPLSFGVDRDHVAQEIDLVQDHDAVSALGLRCIDYLVQTTPNQCSTDKMLRQFLRLIRPQSDPQQRGVVLGIARSASSREGRLSPLLGVLYFLHPRLAPRTWHIALLLLEPAARNQGLGAAIHEAFAQWAAARGAQRLVVTVNASNRKALHFWRDRLGYLEAGSIVRPLHTPLFRQSYELQYRLPTASSPAPWVGL